MTPALLTENLLLRPLEHEDAFHYAALINAKGIAEGLCAEPLPFTVHHASARILMRRAAEMTANGYGWAVENNDGDFIGLVTIDHIGTKSDGPISARKGAIGFAIDPAFQGMGAAKEALDAVLGWARISGKFGQLLAEVAEESIAAHHVLAFLGFAKTGSQTRFNLAQEATIKTIAFRWAAGVMAPTATEDKKPMMA